MKSGSLDLPSQCPSIRLPKSRFLASIRAKTRDRSAITDPQSGRRQMAAHGVFRSEAESAKHCRIRPPPGRHDMTTRYHHALGFDAAGLATGPTARDRGGRIARRLLQNIAIVAALFVLFAVLRVSIEAGSASSSTAAPYRPALAVHTRLNRALPRGISTCAARSWGCVSRSEAEFVLESDQLWAKPPARRG
jgi:hypothetical protein